MTWIKKLGSIYKTADLYIDNRLELAKVEVTDNVSKAINKAVTFGFIMFIGAIIYVLLLLMVIVLLNNLTHSILTTYLIVLIFHIALLVLGLRIQKTWFRGFIEKFLSVEFTDIEDPHGSGKMVSLEAYKSALKSSNVKLLDDIKGDIKSVLYIDHLLDYTKPHNTLVEGTEKWEQDQQDAYNQFRALFDEEFKPNNP